MSSTKSNSLLIILEAENVAEFMTLIGEIFLIVCIQSVIEVFVDLEKRPYMAKIVNFACYAGALYLLLQFVFNFLLREVFRFMQHIF